MDVKSRCQETKGDRGGRGKKKRRGTPGLDVLHKIVGYPGSWMIVDRKGIRGSTRVVGKVIDNRGGQGKLEAEGISVRYSNTLK